MLNGGFVLVAWMKPSAAPILFTRSLTVRILRRPTTVLSCLGATTHLSFRLQSIPCPTKQHLFRAKLAPSAIRRSYSPTQNPKHGAARPAFHHTTATCTSTATPRYVHWDEYQSTCIDHVQTATACSSSLSVLPPPLPPPPPQWRRQRQ